MGETQKEQGWPPQPRSWRATSNVGVQPAGEARARAKGWSVHDGGTQSQIVRVPDDVYSNAALQAKAHLETLQPDWDGEGAIAPSPAAVSSACEFVRNLSIRMRELHLRPPKVTPGFSPYEEGSVDIGWQLPTGHLTINFASDGTGRYFAVRLGTGAVAKGETSDLRACLFAIAMISEP